MTGFRGRREMGVNLLIVGGYNLRIEDQAMLDRYDSSLHIIFHDLKNQSRNF